MLCYINLGLVFQRVRTVCCVGQKLIPEMTEITRLLMPVVISFYQQGARQPREVGQPLTAAGAGRGWADEEGRGRAGGVRCPPQNTSDFFFYGCPSNSVNHFFLSFTRRCASPISVSLRCSPNDALTSTL